MNARRIWLSCCVLFAAAVPALAGPEEAVVRVIAAPTLPKPGQPWLKPAAAGEGGGTGVVIEGKRILTNAHVVMYSPNVYVQARPGDDKFEAKVQVMDRDIDLAILTVKDERFFAKKPALARLDRLPRVQDGVTVYGFPIGGNDMSVTKGEISHIDFKTYGYRGTGTVIQISAPINPGNSGGPAVVGDKMVGVIQSVILGAQNIGYIIPNEEVEIFLSHIKDGRYEGKAIDATRTAFYTTENEALRRKLKLDPSVKGILVQPPPRAPADYPLKPFDIVTKIGEHTIDNTGKVQLANGLRAYFQYLIPRLAKDNSVPLTVWRGGQSLHVLLPVTTRDNRLIPSYAGEALAYFIHGPLVFAPARADDMGSYYRMNPFFYTDNSPLVTRSYDLVQFPGEELVVVSARMFQHKIAKGYGDPVGKVVESVNEVRIKNLRHLVEVLRNCTDEFVTFHFADEWTEVLVFDRQEMERATEEILEDNGIAVTRRGSAELLKLWKTKPAASR